jgi:hypothetical protein
MRSPYWQESSTHKFRKGGRRSPRGSFEYDYANQNCPKRKKLDSSNKYDYANRNYYIKGDNNKKNRFRDKKKKKKF